MKWFWGIVLMTVLATLPALVKAECDCPVQYKRVDHERYELHTIRIPADSAYRLVPVVVEKIAPLPELVKRVPGTPVAAINAGFFDPKNGLTTSYVVRDRKIVANPRDNSRFFENPNLFPYMPQMLNRSEFRVFQCSEGLRYDIARHYDALPGRCTLVHSVQAGPNLFDTKAPLTEAFIAYKGQERIRDPLGVDNRNARSAVGVTPAGDAILVMVKMKPGQEGVPPGGVTLAELSTILRDLGAQKALSLDGGSSSSLWYDGEIHYGKLDRAANVVKRPVKSALVVVKTEPAH